jgi:UDP-glucose 4-epimerase
MKKILITGAAGFISSHIYPKFSKRKYQIWGIDNITSGKMENIPKDRLEQLHVIDVANAKVSNVFQEVKPDIVIHTAAQPSLLTSVETPYIDAAANIMGTLNVAKWCREFEVERLIFTSTSAVTMAEYQQESDPILWEYTPDSPYGISKLAGEIYVKYFMPQKHVILRLGNVYGERQIPLGKNQLVPHAIRYVLGKEDFALRTDGNATRDYIHAADVARAIFMVSTKKGICGTFNIGTGCAHTAWMVLQEIDWAFGHTSPTDWSKGEARDERGDILLNIDKAKEILGFEAKIPLRKGIERTVRWWRNNP